MEPVQILQHVCSFFGWWWWVKLKHSLVSWTLHVNSIAVRKLWNWISNFMTPVQILGHVCAVWGLFKHIC
jgi:hypothetical protein